MKLKNFLLVGAAAVALAACSNNSDNKATTPTETTPAEEAQETVVTYAGEIPGADCTFYYNLVLENDVDDNDGDFTLTQTVVGDESIAPTVTKGDYKVMTNDATNQKYMKLTPDADENGNIDENDVYYFLINDNNTITMVGADLQPAASGLNYTLPEVK